MATTTGRTRAFLGVEASLSNRRWMPRLDPAGENRALAIGQSCEIPELLARVLAGRGVTAGTAEAFLDPTLRALMPDPSCLTDMDRAAERLADAVCQRQRIGVIGDYDVDGAAASALTGRFLGAFGIACDIHIPDRLIEGYGPSEAAIDRLIDAGARLILTVDCGSGSHVALARAMDRGIDVIVVDHHQMGEDKPPCAALVNPNRDADMSGLGQLCAAGLVFLLLAATRRELRRRGEPRATDLDLKPLLDLVALATVCDVVPLKGLNRAYVRQGLVIARFQGNAGLAALAAVSNVDGPLAVNHLGYRIGPRINAGGRIGDPSLGSRLLCLDDPGEAREIATTLDRLNRERQTMERQTLMEAVAEAEAEIGDGEGPAVIVTASRRWHPGIVGIVAARLRERFDRPAFAIAFDANGLGTGSGRSIPGFDVGALVRAAVAKGFVAKGGGHAMAAGLSVARDRLGTLRAFFEREAGSAVAGFRSARTLRIDGALTAGGATGELVELVDRAGPYGAGHPQPVFALPGHRVADARILGNAHLKLRVVDDAGGKIGAIAFGAGETAPGKALLNGKGQRFHFAGILEAGNRRNASSVEMRLLDAALPD